MDGTYDYSCFHKLTAPTASCYVDARTSIPRPSEHRFNIVMHASIVDGIRFRPAAVRLSGAPQGELMVGLTWAHDHRLGFHSYEDIDFAFHLTTISSAGAADLLVSENGQTRGKVTDYIPGDFLTIRVNAAGQVEYIKNGNVVYTRYGCNISVISMDWL